MWFLRKLKNTGNKSPHPQWDSLADDSRRGFPFRQFPRQAGELPKGARFAASEKLSAVRLTDEV